MRVIYSMHNASQTHNMFMTQIYFNKYHLDFLGVSFGFFSGFFLGFLSGFFGVFWGFLGVFGFFGIFFGGASCECALRSGSRTGGQYALQVERACMLGNNI